MAKSEGELAKINYFPLAKDITYYHSSFKAITSRHKIIFHLSSAFHFTSEVASASVQTLPYAHQSETWWFPVWGRRGKPCLASAPLESASWWSPAANCGNLWQASTLLLVWPERRRVISELILCHKLYSWKQTDRLLQHWIKMKWNGRCAKHDLCLYGGSSNLWRGWG